MRRDTSNYDNNTYMVFEQEFEVRWGEVDANIHLRGAAYMDMGDQVRVAFFRSHKLDFNTMIKLGVGPILFGCDIRYYREILMSERIRFTMKRWYLSDDRRKWGFVHEVFKADGSLAALLKPEGAFLDLKTRKITPAPEQGVAAVLSLDEYVEPAKSSK